MSTPTIQRLDTVPEVNSIPWIFNDGGRAFAGYKGRASDCVCRAISIATGKAYQEIYDDLIECAKRERRRDRSHPRTGVYKPTIRRYLGSLGWTWTPTMHIGSGTTVHLREGELPEGRLIVSVSRHLVAVIDGVVHDTHDPARDGNRCVYGYWTKEV